MWLAGRVSKKTPALAPLAALMGAGARYEGDLSFEGRVRVDGHFEGRIYTEDLLEVGVDGHVEGQADVARAVVSGRMTGEIRVREHLRIEATGLVSGHLDAGIVELVAGGRIEGEILIRGHEQP